MAEKTEEAALLAKTEGAPDNGRVLVMTDGEETLGYVVVALEDDTLVFYGFSVSGQTDFTKAKPDPMTTFVLDTLMRSAASFGETNGMNHIRTAFPDFFDFFKQRGFAVAEDHAEAPMSLIVHYAVLPQNCRGLLPAVFCFFRKFRFSPAIGCIFRLKMVKYLDRIKVGYYVLCEEHKISRKT